VILTPSLNFTGAIEEELLTLATTSKDHACCAQIQTQYEN
jgi:hypothetical protein